MKLLNFEIETPDAIAIRAINLYWDLHNFAQFLGMRLEPDTAVVLTWAIPDSVPSGGFATDNPYRGCELWFRGLRSLEVRAPETGTPISENRKLHQLASYSANGSTRVPSDGSYVVVTFIGGLSIRIDAAEAEFHPLKQAPTAQQ